MNNGRKKYRTKIRLGWRRKDWIDISYICILQLADGKNPLGCEWWKGPAEKNDNGFVLVATLLPAFMRRAPGRLPHSFKPLLNPLEFFKSPSNFFNIVIVFSKHMPKLHSTNFPTVLFNTKDDCRPFKEFEVQNDMGDKVSHDAILQRASLTLECNLAENW